MTTATILPYIHIAVACAALVISFTLTGIIKYWRAKAKRYEKQLEDVHKQRRGVPDWFCEQQLAEKARYDGPKILAEDPAPNKAMQASIEPAPGCALQVHVPKDLADPRNADELKTQAAKTWDAQHRYRSKMHARGFVRACGDDGHSHWYPLDKTAWIKTSKKWSRVPIASKAFRNALAYFPGTDPKPTQARLVKLASELGTKMELMNDAKRNEARRRSA